jgi:uncharacterized protein (DUF3084 family)
MTPEDWDDVIFDVTGMILSREQAKAISDLIEARVKNVEVERDRLRHDLTIARLDRDHAKAERDENEKAIAVWRGRTERAETERDRLREALDSVMNSHGEQLHDAFAVARAALEEVDRD